jgi:hypothetical protein
VPEQSPGSVTPGGARSNSQMQHNADEHDFHVEVALLNNRVETELGVAFLVAASGGRFRMTVRRRFGKGWATSSSEVSEEATPRDQGCQPGRATKPAQRAG